jgi:hypothetical protein
MFKHSVGRLFGDLSGENEVETRLSRRQMLGVTGLFLLTAPVMLRPSNAIASIVKPAPVADGSESDLTNVPFKPAEDGAEVIDIGRRRRRRVARRRRRRGRRRYYGRRSRYHGRSQWYRRRRRHRPDFCVWGPLGGFCVY